MAYSTGDYFFGTVTTAPLEIIQLFSDLARRGIKSKLIFAKNSIVPSGFNVGKEKQWKKSIKENLIEEKYIQRLPFVVCIKEKMAEVVFTNTRIGEIDTKAIFIGEDRKFRKWSHDLFEYYWNEVPNLNPFKLEER